MSDFEFSEEELNEFHAEATDLLDSAEDAFLSLDKDKNLSAHYDDIIRVFHSIKGGAGMLGLTLIRDHMHFVENRFQEEKGNSSLSDELCSGFLRAIDHARDLLDGKEAKFDSEIFAGGKAAKETPPEASEASKSERKANLEAAKERSDSLGFVCLVDDEPEILSIIEFALEEEGFKTKSFTDPTVALKEIPELNPDAVFTDISMPQMSGDELMKKLHAWNADLPIVFVSGYITKEVLMNALGNGVYAAIDKPINESQLLTTCIHACRRYRALKLIQKAINLLLYQYSNLDEYLQKSGLEDIRKTIQAEVKELLVRSKDLRNISRTVE